METPSTMDWIRAVRTSKAAARTHRASRPTSSRRPWRVGQRRVASSNALASVGSRWGSCFQLRSQMAAHTCKTGFRKATTAVQTPRMPPTIMAAVPGADCTTPASDQTEYVCRSPCCSAPMLASMVATVSVVPRAVPTSVPTARVQRNTAHHVWGEQQLRGRRAATPSRFMRRGWSSPSPSSDRDRGPRSCAACALGHPRDRITVVRTMDPTTDSANRAVPSLISICRLPIVYLLPPTVADADTFWRATHRSRTKKTSNRPHFPNDSTSCKILRVLGDPVHPTSTRRQCLT
mmetsp:Transcript_79824/g.140865  ORF Transcript_79824/g.140865 Transcript_79824/m.140865 type:complete len:291 (+) Transcript_79824:82-954(+)